MKGSLRIARIAGIGVFIHWTFVLIIAWVLFVSYRSGHSAAQAVQDVIFVLSIFVCVVLHELGHAMAARSFGIGTKDITLLPIGGIARLERMPTEPAQELVIALAGPAVNVVIAAGCLAALFVTGGMEAPEVPQSAEEALASIGYLHKLMFVNIFLVVFNMLPAFPMDGGRVLRAVLAFGMSYVRATRVAASVGQVMAVLFAALGLFANPFLLIIAIFVFLGAGAEASFAETRVAYEGLVVRDAMATRYRALAPTDTLGAATDELLAASQEDFPVTEDGASDGVLVGVLSRSDLIRALARDGLNATVQGAMRRDCPGIDESASVQRAVEVMGSGGCPVLPVLRNGRVVGLLTRDNLSELVMIRSALSERGK